MAGVTASASPADAHQTNWGAHSIRFADVQSARWCDGWLLVEYDIEMADRAEVTYLPDDGARTLRLRGRSGRFGPSGVGWVDVRDGPGSPGEGRLHVREGAPEVAAIDPDMVELVYHGVTSAPVLIREGCPS